MNNFNKSSSGVNLTLNCFYDTDRSRSEFEESFYILQHAGFRQHSVLVFNQFGNFDVTDFELTDLDNYDITALTVKDIFKAFYNSQYPTNIDNDLKAGDLSGIKDLYFDLDCGSLKDIDQAGLLECIETQLYCDESFQEFLQNTFNKNYITLNSSGYSQGDYSKILMNI